MAKRSFERRQWLIIACWITCRAGWSAGIRNADQIDIVDVTQHVERCLVLLKGLSLRADRPLHRPTVWPVWAHQRSGEMPSDWRLWRFDNVNQARLELLNFFETVWLKI